MLEQGLPNATTAPAISYSVDHVISHLRRASVLLLCLFSAYLGWSCDSLPISKYTLCYVPMRYLIYRKPTCKITMGTDKHFPTNCLKVRRRRRVKAKADIVITKAFVRTDCVSEDSTLVGRHQHESGKGSKPL